MKISVIFAVVLSAMLSLMAQMQQGQGMLRVTGTVVESWRLEATSPTGRVEDGGTENVEVHLRLNGDTPVTLYAEAANIAASTGCELHIVGATVVSGKSTLPWKTPTHYVLSSTAPVDVQIGCRPR